MSPTLARWACTSGASTTLPETSTTPTPGVYYIHSSGATIGTYYNSERRQSVYAGWTWDYGPWRLQAGAITGYRRTVMPMIAPSVALGYGFRLTVLPKVERRGSSVVHLTWEMKL